MARLAHGRERDRPDRRRRPRAPSSSGPPPTTSSASSTARADVAEPLRDLGVPRAEDRLAPDRRLSGLQVEILGSGGAVTIPRPGLRLPRLRRGAGARASPTRARGPSVFVHGPDVLIDTPEESKLQLNRSAVGADRRRPLLPLAPRPHRRPAGLGVAQLRLPLLASPLRDDADLHPRAGLGRLRGELRARRPVPLHGAAGHGRGSSSSPTNEPFQLGGTRVTRGPARRRERARLPVRGRGQARPRRDGRDARLDAARARAARPRRAPGRRLRAPPLQRRAHDPGGVLQAAGQEDALRPGARARCARSRRGGPCSHTSRRWTACPTTSSSAWARRRLGAGVRRHARRGLSRAPRRLPPGPPRDDDRRPHPVYHDERVKALLASAWLLAALGLLVAGCGGSAKSGAGTTTSSRASYYAGFDPPVPLKATCAHPIGWQRLANRIGADVYCPGWLPDPLTSQIGGTVEQHQRRQQGPQLPRELHLAGHRHAGDQRRVPRHPARLPGADEDPDLPRRPQPDDARFPASRAPTVT